MKYRGDVDGLRALAVLMVLVFHAFPERLTGGFIGVDIFFVISGYLISGIIQEYIGKNRFSILRFYAHRVRRIFPALIVVLAFVFVAGWFLLLRDEFGELRNQIAAGVLFSSNILFWSQAGYFDTASELKPLLHLWSLGVEEQFYILWPLILTIGIRSRRAAVFIAGTMGVSFLANLFLVGSYPSATFFLPFTRFWELAAGALLVFCPALPRKLHGPASIIGLGVILVSAWMFTATQSFPGWRAALPVCGSMLLLLSRDSILNRGLSLAPARFVGKVSYPLYLWHWPLLVFAGYIYYGTSIPALVRLSLLVLSFGLAVATYFLAEKPIRSQPATGGLVVTLGACMAAFLVSTLVFRVEPRSENSGVSVNQLAWPYWKNDICTSKYPWEEPNGWWFCVANRETPPEIIILGNSHANHLYPGFASNLGSQSILSIGTCDPADGVIRSVTGAGENPCFGERKIEQATFLRSIISANPTIKYAIVSSSWPIFNEHGLEVNKQTGVPVPLQYTAFDPSQDKGTPALSYKAAISRTIGFLEKEGIQVVVFLDNPSLPYDIRACLSRPFAKSTATCEIDSKTILETRDKTRSMFESLQMTHKNLLIFDPTAVFCDSQTCGFMPGGVPLLRDATHLSVEGSQRVVERFIQWATGQNKLESLIAEYPK